MNTQEAKVYAKLLSVAFLIHSYGIGDELYFYRKFPDMDESILNDIWKLSSQKEKIIDNYSQLNDEELTKVEFELKYYRNNSFKILEHISKPIPRFSVNLKVENELRRRLALMYISSAVYSIHNKLGIPYKFLAPKVRIRERRVKKIIIVLTLITFVGLYFSQRLVDGFTPVDKLAKEYYEESRYKYSGAICFDGWISHSQGRGTCSHHGGVFRYFEEGEHTKTFEECLRLAKERSWLD